MLLLLLIVLVPVVLALVAVSVWFIVPTLRTFRGPGFEPSAKDDESVLRAQQTRMVDGGAGGV